MSVTTSSSLDLLQQIHVFSWTEDSRVGCSSPGGISSEWNRGAESPLSGDSLSLSSDFSCNKRLFLVYTNFTFPFQIWDRRSCFSSWTAPGCIKISSLQSAPVRSWLNSWCHSLSVPKRLWQIRAQIKTLKESSQAIWHPENALHCE